MNGIKTIGEVLVEHKKKYFISISPPAYLSGFLTYKQTPLVHKQ